MINPYEVIIIGAGQAGLSVSYYLTQNKINHIVIDKDNRLASSWRYRKWDSFTFVTPNSMNRLPDFPCSKYEDDVFLNKEQVCQYIQDFADSFNPPVKLGEIALKVSKKISGLFEVVTDKNIYMGKKIVIATSCFNYPNIPSISENIPKSVQQMHSSNYKNPDLLDNGAVLVVGSAQSGAQIVEELVESGREVYCATSKVVKTPRKYRGKDITEWARLVGILDQKGVPLSDLNGHFPSSPQITGKNGGHEIHFQNLMRKGLVLLGRLLDVESETFKFDNNLSENMRFAHDSCRQWIERIDHYIKENKIEAPTPDYLEPLHENYENAPESISIKKNNISAIIWATGYKYDYTWIKENVFDKFKYPDTDRGVSKCDGLYFVGLPSLDLNKSALMYGIAEHAKYVSDHIIINLDLQTESEAS